jgi:hypothetical protein
MQGTLLDAPAGCLDGHTVPGVARFSSYNRDLRKRCAEGGRDGVASRRWKPAGLGVSQVHKGFPL